jgi:hypothetical protein
VFTIRHELEHDFLRVCRAPTGVPTVLMLGADEFRCNWVGWGAISQRKLRSRWFRWPFSVFDCIVTSLVTIAFATMKWQLGGFASFFALLTTSIAVVTIYVEGPKIASWSPTHATVFAYVTDAMFYAACVSLAGLLSAGLGIWARNKLD